MVKFEFEYIEIDGLLYLSIEIEGKADLDNLRKYGRLRLNYLHEQKPEIHRELPLTGKLAKKIRTTYLEMYPMSGEETMGRVRLSKIAQEIADELLLRDLIYSPI